MYRCILLAADASDLSGKAEAAAIGLAALCGASLVVAHVIPDYPLGAFEGGAAVSSHDLSRSEARWHDKGHAVLERVVAAAAARGVAARGVLLHADRVAEALLAAAGKHGADLIVMASHGRHGLRRLLLGSQTQHVLSHGQLPVLVIR